MKYFPYILIFLFSFPVLSQDNQEGNDKCEINLSFNNATVAPGDTNQVIQQTFTISRGSKNDKKCTEYRLFFSKGLANDYQRKAYNSLQQFYNYNLHRNINMSGILKEYNDALNPSEYLEGQMLLQDTEYTNSFYISVPAISSQTNPRAGLYRDSVQISLYSIAENEQPRFQLSTNYQVSVNIPVRVNISLVNEGDPFNVNSTSKVMDFGTLEAQEEMGADIVVDSNTPYSIRMSSLNNGKLKNGSDEINYSLRVGSGNVNLSNSSSSPVTVATGSSPTPVAGDRYNLRVKVLSLPQDPAAGVYQDSITITAIAN